MTQESVRFAPTEKVLIGRITATYGARVHLAFSGRTPCGSARSSRITIPATTYRDIDLKLLCIRCFTPENLTRAQSEVTMGGRFNAALDNFLCEVRLIVGYAPEAAASTAVRSQPTAPAKTPAAVAEHRPAFAAFLRRRDEQTKAKPAGSWGQIAASFAKNHKPEQARAAA